MRQRPGLRQRGRCRRISGDHELPSLLRRRGVGRGCAVRVAECVPSASPPPLGRSPSPADCANIQTKRIDRLHILSASRPSRSGALCSALVRGITRSLASGCPAAVLLASCARCPTRAFQNWYHTETMGELARGGASRGSRMRPSASPSPSGRSSSPAQIARTSILKE